MILLVTSGGEAVFPDWQAQFREFAPHLDVRSFHDPDVPADQVGYVLAWDPGQGRLAQFPNLRLICSSGAGVDNILRDPALPAHVPLVRMAEPETFQMMGEYVALACLSLLRDLPRMIAAQAARRWDTFDQDRTANQTRVGLMGMGNLGQVSATMLRALGFPVAGWSRSRRSVAGVDCFAGPEELDRFLAMTDILVCLLPDTPQTRGIIDAGLLARLPRGASVVNAARGPHLVLPDLLAALDSGHIASAFLDVFDPEPLADDSPAWGHPRIIVTSHLASLASRRARARYVADTIAAFERGEALPYRYDPGRGY